MRRAFSLGLAVSVSLTSTWAMAVTSSRSVPSSFGGNGHNVSFDGRLFLVRDGQGWQAQLLRPEAITYLPDGLPGPQGPLLSPRVHVLGVPEGTENALAICEDEPESTPYACDESGASSAAGPYDCYDVILLDSDAITPPGEGGFTLRRRSLRVWVQQPKSPSATIHKFEWGTVEPLSPPLLGIEPTVTRDGKLMVWQGHPDNDGDIDVLMYSVNPTACGASGWSAPKPISSMYVDPAVVGTYALGERKLRAADGTPFEEGELFRGAYPWLMPAGDAIVFAAAPMPCVSMENPPGCGPRRNALSVVGYPTNWGVAHIDGGVNPDTNQTVRLFFSSPGPDTFEQLPVTPGLDVWPFFGSNTSNYVELSFDDGLDGNYAGLWHLNESVTHDGELDTTRAPDVSGYFNTALLGGGLDFAKVNDGVVGKGLAFDGVDDRLLVPHASSLNPANGITIEFWIEATDPDCDGENNYRLLISKGGTTEGTYSVVLEEGLAMQFRVNVGGQQQSVIAPPIPASTWTHVAFEYDGPSGRAGVWHGGVQVVDQQVTAGTLTPSNADLTIGTPGPRAACPAGDGAFAGRLDEVAISRYARKLGTPPEPEPGSGGGGQGGGAGAGGAGGAGPGGGGQGGAGGGGASEDGCSCRAGARVEGGSGVALLGIALAIAAVRRAGAARVSRS
jgi:hypothetical protein